jgi:hypothetical protein
MRIHIGLEFLCNFKKNNVVVKTNDLFSTYSFVTGTTRCTGEIIISDKIIQKFMNFTEGLDPEKCRIILHLAAVCKMRRNHFLYEKNFYVSDKQKHREINNYIELGHHMLQIKQNIEKYERFLDPMFYQRITTINFSLVD